MGERRYYPGTGAEQLDGESEHPQPGGGKKPGRAGGIDLHQGAPGGQGGYLHHALLDLRRTKVRRADSRRDPYHRRETTGTAGNGYTPGQINQLVDVYDYYTSCENITTSAGGSDAPDDDEYYELMRSSMDAYSTAGATGSYIYWAKQVSTEIMDVAAVSPTPGIVKIYVLMNGGELAGEQMKAKVLSECSADERRPLAMRQAGPGHQPVASDWRTDENRRQAGGTDGPGVYRAAGRKR